MMTIQTPEPEPLSAAGGLAPGVELEGGRYKLCEKLGAGGHGVVYKALELGHSVQRYVAIKFMNSDRIGESEEATEKATARFKAEAHLVGQVQHANVIQIYTDGYHHGQHYYVMEFIDQSRSLDTILRDAPKGHVTFELVKTCFVAVARGLRAIHRIPGVFHRDIKLSNILVCDHVDGLVCKIIDFGIAHNPKLPLTATGMMMGTEGHVPPECGRCDPKTNKPYVLDHRVDMFALGVSLYQFATGKLPFSTTAESLDPMFSPDLPSSVRPMPKALESIILKLLSKERAERYQTCDEFLAAFDAFDPAAPMVATPATSLTDLPSLSMSLLPPKASSGASNPPDESLKISFAQIVRQQSTPDNAKKSDGGQEKSAASAPQRQPDADLQLSGAAAQHAAALKLDKKRSPRRFLGIKARERLMLCVVSVLAICALTAFSFKKRQPPAAPTAPTIALPTPVEHRTLVTAADVIHDARESRSEFIEKPARIAVPPSEPRPTVRQKQRQRAPSPVARATPSLPVAVDTVLPPMPEKRGSNVLDDYETTLPESHGSVQDPRDASANLGIPAGTQTRVMLSYGLSNSRPNTLAEAKLAYGLTVRGQRIAGPGAKLLGKATYHERGEKWFVEIAFDRLVDTDGSERKVAAIATQDGAAGLEAKVSRSDERTEATVIGNAIDAARDALDNKSGSDLARDLLKDRDEDLRAMRRRVVTVSLPRNFVFQAQFTRAS